MALVQRLRDAPEVAGGNTEAMIPEDAVAEAIARGWKKADGKPAKVEAPKVEAPKVEAPKVEPKVEEPAKEEKADFPMFEKAEEKKAKK